MSSEEEQDYMSADFVTAETPREEETYSQKRKRQIVQQLERGKTKSRKVLEAEAREEGLAKAIEDDNRGKRMLLKMGFKEGSTLGQTDNGAALRQPLEVVMRAGKKGIGLESVQKEAQRQQEAKQMHQEVSHRVDFRKKQMERFSEEKIKRQVHAASKLCVDLDDKKGITDNPLTALYLEEQKAADAAKEERNAFGELVVKPAKEDDTSPLTVFETEQEGEQEDSSFKERVQALRQSTLAVQLEQILSYLRVTHHYCFWCGALYNDAEDLAEYCPGETEEDHD